MKNLIILLILLLSFASVNATIITTCQNITSSGSYTFGSDIHANSTNCNFGEGCILINASDVTLNLNGYKLINDDACSYGIAVIGSSPKNNINVLNGYVYDFTSSQIQLYADTVNADLTYLILNGTQNADGITLSNNDVDLLISAVWFTSLKNGVIGGCSDHCGIFQNEFYIVINGLWLQGNGFIVEQNIMGKTIRNDTACTQNEATLYSGMYLNNVTNSVIRNNDIRAKYGIIAVVDSNHNNITNNMFRKYYYYNPLFSFDSSTSNNVFCQNSVSETKPIIEYLNGVYTCYYRAVTTNAFSLVENLGTGNSITSSCSGTCEANWYCNGNNIQYINTACSLVYNNTCQYGCESGAYGSYCVGQMYYPTTTTTVPPYTQNYTKPVINETDLNEAGLSWTTPFFTPLFLIFLIELIISGILTGLTKVKITFPISIFVITAVFGIFGMFGQYNLWITSFICIITALASAFMLRNTFGG